MPVSLPFLLQNKTFGAHALSQIFCLLNYTAISWVWRLLIHACSTEVECEVVAIARAAATSKTTKAGVRSLELEELAEHLLRVNVS